MLLLWCFESITNYAFLSSFLPSSSYKRYPIENKLFFSTLVLNVVSFLIFDWRIDIPPFKLRPLVRWKSCRLSLLSYSSSSRIHSTFECISLLVLLLYHSLISNENTHSFRVISPILSTSRRKKKLHRMQQEGRRQHASTPLWPFASNYIYFSTPYVL